MVDKMPMSQVCSDLGKWLCNGNKQVGWSGNTSDSYLSLILLELFLVYCHGKHSPSTTGPTDSTLWCCMVLVTASVMQHHSLVIHPFSADVNMVRVHFIASFSLTSGMIGYGMAKAAVHQLTKSLAAENSGLPPNSLSVAIVPVTLDTPMNRKWMPNADFSTWTPLEFVAE